MYNDTIAAIATALSNSGIGIVRISGDQSFAIIDRIYKGKKQISKQESHTANYGFICDGEDTIDEVLVMIYRGPRSYTGEDSIEINCHGGAHVVKRILETVVKYGARPAEPGEFTKRAFLNGRIDLSQAEAVGDLIHAQNEYARKNAIGQLKGSLQKKIAKIRERILYHTAFIESALDDPEHISIDGYGLKLEEEISVFIEQLEELISSADDGRIMKEGIQTVILGKPNAGKSSLLNLLLGKDRAIVTDIAGTTRDILEEHIQLGGISLNMIDTAGIRTTDDTIEKIGVEKAKESAQKADLIIYVVDSSRSFDEADQDIIEMIKDKKVIVLLNKVDLDQKITKESAIALLKHPCIEISAREGYGAEAITELLKEMFYQGDLTFNDEIYITSVRQKQALEEGQKSLVKVKESIANGMPEDFYSIDLLDAYEFLGNITGETIGEDLVNEIFSKFCTGK